MLVSKLFRRNTGELPQWARDILAATPARGDGLNRWLLRAAIALRRCERSEHDIQQSLLAATADQPIRPGEIERAVQRSADFLTDSGTPAPAPRRWSTENESLRRKIIEQSDGVEVADLWDASPYRLVDSGPDTEQIVDWLFPGNPLLCCASKLSDANTAPREEWRGRLGQRQFIVPSPMSALTGQTQDGRESARCLENVGPRKYLIIEQDSGSEDEQAAVILHLAQRAPLVLVLHSGNKSLHAWFACQGASEAQQRKFFDDAVMLGADPATWTACQLVRMPEARRDNGRRQPVLYLNTEGLS